MVFAIGDSFARGAKRHGDINTTSLSDSEVVLQCVGAAAILFPDER